MVAPLASMCFLVARLCLREGVDLARERSGVELAAETFAERRQLRDVQQEIPGLGDGPVLLHDRAQLARACVAEDVCAVEVRNRRAAIYVAAGDGAVSGIVRPHENRVTGTRRFGAAVVRCESLAQIPSPVDARLSGRRVVDLFPEVLADVADPHVASDSVE